MCPRIGAEAGLEQDDRQDAGADQRHLPKRAPFDVAAVEIGNQVGHRDVEKVARREGQHVRQEVGDVAILLRAGYSRSRALTLNMMSAVGGVLGALTMLMTS